MGKLTDTKIRQTKPGDKPIKLQDGDGLYLDIRPSGVRVWRYRYWITSEKDGRYTIGDYPATSLADARKAVEWVRAQVKLGNNPTVVRDAEKLARMGQNAQTFEAVAREWADHNRGEWSDKYQAQYERYMEADVYTRIGTFPIRSVTAAHVLEIIRAVERRGAPTIAALIRQWCGQVFRFAVATLRADSDPTGALRGALKRRQVRHNPPLSKSDIPEFLIKLEEYGGYAGTVAAIRLMLLTFVRTVEMRMAEWSEFDFDSSEWRIPAARMKMGKKMKVGEVHIVPLSRQSVAILRELHRLSGGGSLLFPNLRSPKRPITSTTINRALERMGYAGKFSGHGFRATASTLLHEMGWSPDVIERQLAHAERNAVRAAYNHAEHMTERRAMMQAWADWIDKVAQDAEKAG